MGRLTVDLNGHLIKLPQSLRKYEPTHVSRYWIIAQVLSLITGPTVKLLDVGGKEGLLKEFGFKPTVIDLEASNEPNFIQGNALDMPFDNKMFDASVSCDVLEHIEAPDRHQFISEMLRVSKIAVICAPFDHAGVAEVENEVNSYYKYLLKRGHRWLQEHIDNGLPSEEETAKTIRKLGYNFVKVRHFSLDIWPMVLKAHLLHAAFGDSKDVVRAARRLYGTYYDDLCAYDFSARGYRTFFIISKDELVLNLPRHSKRTEKKQKFLDDMSNILLSAIEDQSATLRKIVRSKNTFKETLNEKNAEVQRLSKELEQIKSSKSWQLAQGLAKIKRRGK